MMRNLALNAAVPFVRAVSAFTPRPARARWTEEWLAGLDHASHALRARRFAARRLWAMSVSLIAGVDPPAGDNAANLNLFFHARELDGSPYRFGRSAQHEEYHRIPNYIATRESPLYETMSANRPLRSRRRGPDC